MKKTYTSLKKKEKSSGEKSITKVSSRFFCCKRFCVLLVTVFF